MRSPTNAGLFVLVGIFYLVVSYVNLWSLLLIVQRLLRWASFLMFISVRSCVAWLRLDALGSPHSHFADFASSKRLLTVFPSSQFTMGILNTFYICSPARMQGFLFCSGIFCRGVSKANCFECSYKSISFKKLWDIKYRLLLSSARFELRFRIYLSPVVCRAASPRYTRLVSLALWGLRFKKRLLIVFCALTVYNGHFKYLLYMQSRSLRGFLFFLDKFRNAL